MVDIENPNFKNKTYKELFLTQLQDAYEQGLLSSDNKFMDYIQNREDIENNYVMQSSVHNKTLSTAYEDMQKIYNALDVDNASNNDLDNIGELVGLIRNQAQSSLVEQIFYVLNDAEADILIPAGTIVTSEDNTETNYYTVEDATIPMGSTSVTTSALSVDKGDQTRVNKKVLTRILTNLQQDIPVKVYTYNTITSTGGRVQESDEEYRSRIKRWPYILKRGTLDCYLNYLENVEGLNGYNLIQRWDGPGTMKIIIDPGTDYLINTIMTGLEDEVIIADDDIVIVGAEEVTVDVDLVVNITLDNNINYTSIDTDSLAEKVKGLINTYIDGGVILAYRQISYTQDYGNVQREVYEDAYRLVSVDYNGLTIGENFIPSKCSNFIDDQLNLQGDNPIKNIEFSIPSTFTADSTTDYYGDVADDETATTGIITVKII